MRGAKYFSLQQCKGILFPQFGKEKKPQFAILP